MSFNGTFLIYFSIFIVVLLYCGWITRKWVHGSNDYFIAGREVGVLNNVFGVAAIGFAGTIITLGPGLAVISGFWGSYAFGIVYLFGGLALYGLVFAPYIRRSGAHTLPEWLEMRFDSKTRTLVTITSILGLLGIMANNVVSMAIVATGFTGWSLIWTLSIIFIMFLLFTYIGGFWAVTLTDFVQMCIGLVALPAMLISILIKFGGLNYISQNWSGDFNYWTHGINNGQLPFFSLQYPSFLTFIILFACFLVWGNNYYWLRVSSTRNEKVAKRSYIYAAILLAVGPFLILSISGLYAGSAFADSFAPKGDIDPMAAFGVILKALPIGIAAFALLGALAASISTSTTALLGASSTATRDLYQRYYKPNSKPTELTIPSKIITMVLGLLVWLLCFYPGGPLYLFAFSTAWLGPPSVLVFLGIWWKRTTTTGAFYGALFGIGITAIFTVLDLFKVFMISAYTHIGVIGLLVTVIATVVGSLVTEPHYYSRKDWLLKDTSGVQQVEISKEEKEVLKLISNDYRTMADISDMLGVDSSVSNKLIEALDKKRLIFRENYVGPGFYTFELSELGANLINHNKRALGTLTDEEAMFIKQLDLGQEALHEYIKERELDSLKVSAILSKLVRLNHVKDGGIWKRKVSILKSTNKQSIDSQNMNIK